MATKRETKFKKVPIRIHADINYVLSSDILKVHGKRWVNKLNKLMAGSTGMIVPAGDPSHGKKTAQFVVYSWDYERFAAVINKGEPTYFD